MPGVQFSHGQLGDLTINTGINQISWAYGLNTQTYPTYGGEVVQILSAYIDNITVQGDVTSYRKMEEIYAYFLAYAQIATQGQGNSGTKYSEDPIIMTYPHRGWTIPMKPISVPGLRYGRDVVVPQWQLTAAAVDPQEQDIVATSLDDAMAMAANGDLTLMDAINQLQFHVISDVGYSLSNPFSDPDASGGALAQQLIGNQKLDNLDDIADKFNDLVIKYTQGTFSDGLLKAFQDQDSPFSKPAAKNKTGAADGKTQQTQQVSKKTTQTNTGTNDNNPFGNSGILKNTIPNVAGLLVSDAIAKLTSAGFPLVFFVPPDQSSDIIAHPTQYRVNEMTPTDGTIAATGQNGATITLLVEHI